MRKEEKTQVIDSLVEVIDSYPHLYFTDISGLNAEGTSGLRRKCFEKGIRLLVVKNTLLKLAMDKVDKNFEGLYETLVGNTALMFSEIGNAPAKIIEDFRKKNEKPILKGAYVEESIYIGDDQIKALSTIKSKEELIGDVITILQSPIKNVMSSLNSGNNILAGLMKTLSEKN
jgi:large subunit ribosomal protein L10